MADVIGSLEEEDSGDTTNARISSERRDIGICDPGQEQSCQEQTEGDNRETQAMDRRKCAHPELRPMTSRSVMV